MRNMKLYEIRGYKKYEVVRNVSEVIRNTKL